VVVLAVDLPRITSECLEALAETARTGGISVVPRGAEGFEPLAAAWHRSALPALRESLAAGRPLRETCVQLAAAGLVQPRAIAPNEDTWSVNLNTPQDAARWRA
jgi:molybdopterin-guanine dinucleotide biosynthesis protein A